MELSQHFQQLACYNLWADQLLLQHLAPLNEQQYQQDCGLFFQSIHNTLNHQLLGSSVWYGRLTQKPFPFEGLNQELYTDRQTLFKALLQKSHDWVEFTHHIAPSRFDEILNYRTSKGVEVNLPFAGLLTHAFNHSAHHRGQISAIISRFEQPVPEMDLVYYLLEQTSS